LLNKHTNGGFMEIQKVILNSIRVERNNLLKQSDWTQLPDSPFAQEEKTAWKNYRQQLRDLTQTIDISNINYWDDGVINSIVPKKPN
jgi:hypothetical protein